MFVSDDWSSQPTVSTATAVLSDSTALGPDIFGQHVAVSDSGDRILAADGYNSANEYERGQAHVFDKPAGGWATTSTPTETLTSPPESGNRLFFGADVAITGENTVIIGQPEAASFLDEIPGQEIIVTGPGRAFSYDLTNLAAAEETALELAPPPEATKCTSSMADDLTTHTCPLSTEGGPAMITIPAGTPDGAFTISGSVTVDGGEEGTDDDQSYSASLEVTIGTVDEVTEVTFALATDDDKSTISAADGSTTLQLSVLNENGTASAGGKIASVLFTTTSGTLSLDNPGGGCTGSSGLACQVPVDALDATNSDAIQVSLTHPGSGQSGTAAVHARVLSVAGASFAPDPIEIIFSGPAETLALSEPSTSLLNVDTPDMDTDDEAQDDRDMMTLSVTAEDKSGNSVTASTVSRVRFQDPDGKTVPDASVVARVKIKRDENDDPVLEGGEQMLIKDAADNPQIELNVETTDALATGAYTLEVTADGKTATQTINVSAGAAAVALSADGAAEIGQRLTITAEVTDANGGAVADGTPITFVEGAAQAAPVLVRVSAETTTTGGAASAVYLVVGPGAGYLTVSSGDSASDVLLIQTTEPTAEPVPPAESLGSTAPNGFTTYLGAEATTASALLAGLEGVSGILLWDGSGWQRYIVADGREGAGFRRLRDHGGRDPLAERLSFSPER